MARYAQLARLLYEENDLKRMYFMCGPDRVLIEELIDAIRHRVGASQMDTTLLSAAEVPSKEIWAAINSYPMEASARRFVLIRDCENIKDWTHFLEWASSRHLPQVHAIFVSNAKEVDTTTEYIKRFVASGRFLQAGPVNEEESIEWILYSGVKEKEIAKHLYDRVAGNLYAARNVIEKAKVIDSPLTFKTIDALSEQKPLEEFMERLIRMDKVAAVRAIPSVSQDEVSQIVGQLDYRVGQIAKLRLMLSKGATTKDIMMGTKIPGFVLKPMLQYQKWYDRNKLRECHMILGMVDEAYQKGVRVGLLELLVAVW